MDPKQALDLYDQGVISKSEFNRFSLEAGAISQAEYDAMYGGAPVNEPGKPEPVINYRTVKPLTIKVGGTELTGSLQPGSVDTMPQLEAPEAAAMFVLLW